MPPPHTAPRAYALLALAAAGCGSFESAELPNGDIRMNVEASDTGDGELVVKGGYRGVVASQPGQTLLVTFARTSQPSLGPTRKVTRVVLVRSTP